MRGFLGFSFGEAPSDGYVLTYSDALGRYKWGPVTASSITGLVAAQLVFGSASGGLSQDSGLTYDATAGLSTSKPITSTLPNGTAPFVVASSTVVANLNAGLLLGGTWAAPGASIGTTTAVAGVFTNLTATGAMTLGGNLGSNLLTGTPQTDATGANQSICGLRASRNTGGTSTALLDIQSKAAWGAGDVSSKFVFQTTAIGSLVKATRATLDDVALALTVDLQLANAFAAGAPAATGYVTVLDSTGTPYKLLCAP